MAESGGEQPHGSQSFDLGHIGCKPVQHQFGVMLEVCIAVPTASYSLNPEQLLFSNRNIVQHDFHVAGDSQDIIVHLVEESRDPNTLCPVKAIASIKADARFQDDA